VSNIGAREVVVYERNKDGALKYIQAIKVRYVVDNIFIDPTNGHMWVAVFPRPLNVLWYMADRSVPVEGRLLHIALSEEEDAPFSPRYSKIEEVFETDGTEFGAVTIGVYSNNKLLLGTVGLNFMFCDHFQPSF
jgi:hypothetical protein